MRNFVVGTVHEEIGAATNSALQAIIGHIRPDTIFGEVAPNEVDGYRDGSRGTLEAMAVARYREGREVTVVPVDLETPDTKFFRDVTELDRIVKRTSRAYRELLQLDRVETHDRGFEYLNSDACMRQWIEIYAELRATIDHMGQSRFAEIYGRWTARNELREAAWVSSIEHYANNGGATRGVFLVGAAHLRPIQERVRAPTSIGPREASWALGYSES